MANLIPGLIPAEPEAVAPPPTPTSNPFSLYDVSINGIGFVMSNTPNTPMVRETVPLEKQRVDQAQTPGENTLTSWWIKSQDSFHGGAGQLQLEPAVPQPVDHVRYDLSKNVDPWTPGRVRRLPDTVAVSTDDAAQVLGVTVSGADAVAYVTTGGAVKLVTTPAGTPSTATFSGATGVVSAATDGRWIYAANGSHVYRLDPASVSTTVTVATYATAPFATAAPVLGWVKSRLMLGVDGGIYELDVTASGTTLGSTQLRYQHPTVGFAWRCFSTNPSGILAAGDAGGVSSIVLLNLNMVSGAPVLQLQGEIGVLPVGERVLSMANSQGTFVAIGTTEGVRVGSCDTYTGALTYGPLELLPTDPTIPAVSLCCRDRFVYAAGFDYDEGGLLRVDLGTVVDQAGRFAWSPDLITPAFTTTAATSVVSLPVSGSLVFSVPGTGVLLEGVGPGTGPRDSWLRTSRIRYSTVEPKLFKLGRVRGNLTSGEIQVRGTTPFTTANLITVGFTDVDPDEFRLPAGLAEWMQLTFTLLGETAELTSYQTKALPGTRRQRHYQFVLNLSDAETTKSGQRITDRLSSRRRLAALEELDAAGDEVELQEFTPAGVTATRVVIEMLSFKQNGRPTRTSDLGGDVTILLRTVES